MIGSDGDFRGENHLLRRSVPDATTNYVEGSRAIDAQKVVEVALNPDDELRNLQVALLYSLTSERLARRLLHALPPDAPGTLRTNANWFTVAQWAVLTVGRNIRTRDLPHRTTALPSAVRRLLTPAVLNLRSADDRIVAAALSYGQVMVFTSVYAALLRSGLAEGDPLPDPRRDDPPLEAGPPAVGNDPPAEVGPPSADGADASSEGRGPVTLDVVGLAEMVDGYVAEARRQEAVARQRDAAQRVVVLELAEQLGVDTKALTIHLRADRPTFYREVLDAIAARAGHQDELAEAFALYRRAAHWEEGERPPADLLFEATMRIMAVEQVILDRAVSLVVDHLPRHVTEQAEGRIATFAERNLRVPRLIANVNANKRLAFVAAAAKDIWARVMTDQVMVVAFPTETVRLGRDIPHRDWREPFYAPDLRILAPEAAAVFDQFDRSLGDGRGAGAGDWRRFDDRMNFSVNLLRSRQQDPTLFWQPYTEEDVERVWEGAYPNRLADPFEQAVRSPSFPADLRCGPFGPYQGAGRVPVGPPGDGGDPSAGLRSQEPPL